MKDFNVRSGRFVHRYTKFPNLFDVVDHSVSGPWNSQDSVLLPSHIKKASVILSWALLLRGYTNAETVVFDVDQKTFAVDFEGEALEEVQAEVQDEEDSGHTAVYFQEVCLLFPTR